MITTSHGNIRVNKIQTGWAVRKNESGFWELSDFDEDIVIELKTKKECLEHYAAWYVH